jgi:hypothetical protein
MAERCAFFSPQSPEFQWNVFDTTLVAISYWELLTKVWKIDPNRLYATYYGGDKKQPKVPVDTEA